MLKNNKGFMLAEAVITSTIVLTTLMSFYTAFNKLYSEYEIRSRYYNIDGAYANKNLLNNLIETGEINKIFSDNDAGFKNKNYIFFVNNRVCVNITDCNYINSLVTLYNIENVVIIEWSKSSIDETISKLSSTGINETFKDYLNNYVKKHYDFSNDSGYNYIIITEYKDENSKKEEYNYSSTSLR